MQKFTHLSCHGRKRLSERTQLTEDEMEWMLDRKCYINSGSTPGFNKEHLIFYSLPDDKAFVAIRDRLTGLVITVLPENYHANLAWEILEGEVEKAKGLAKNMQPYKTTQQVEIKDKKFFVSVHFIDENGFQKAKLILKQSADKYGGNLQAFVDELKLIDNIKEVVNAKKLKYKMLLCLSIRLGSHGEANIIDLPVS